jgi:hypothetical protein
VLAVKARVGACCEMGDCVRAGLDARVFEVVVDQGTGQGSTARYGGGGGSVILPRSEACMAEIASCWRSSGADVDLFEG